jgi:hypothetical protein
MVTSTFLLVVRDLTVKLQKIDYQKCTERHTNAYDASCRYLLLEENRRHNDRKNKRRALIQRIQKGRIKSLCGKCFEVGIKK